LFLDIFGSVVWWKDAQTQQHLQVPQINDLQFFCSKNLCWLSDETGRRHFQPKTLPRHRQLAGCTARVLNGFWLLVYYVVNFYGFPKPNFRCWHSDTMVFSHQHGWIGIFSLLRMKISIGWRAWWSEEWRLWVVNFPASQRRRLSPRNHWLKNGRLRKFLWSNWRNWEAPCGLILWKVWLVWLNQVL
jgi:hypothetical protein